MVLPPCAPETEGLTASEWPPGSGRDVRGLYAGVHAATAHDDDIGGDGGLSRELTEGKFTYYVHRGWGEDGSKKSMQA